MDKSRLVVKPHKLVPAKVFDRGGEPPEVEDNVTLVKGWFEDTIEQWIMCERMDTISFMNLDADIYVSTKIVLDKLQL